MPRDLQYGRECYERGAWSDAYASLARADLAEPIDGEDLRRLGVSACLIGRSVEFETYFARLYHLHLEHGEQESAARSAYWIGLNLLIRGEVAQSSAWTARGQRLVENIDCVEKGYVLVPLVERQLRERNAEVAHEGASVAANVGARFGDAELLALARNLEARALVQLDQTPAGLDLLDEVMLPVVGGELSPIVTGHLYCSVIETCRKVYAMRRAREWTLAFSRWCERQPEAFTFGGICLVDRAEILRFHGEWPGSLADAFRACEWAARENRKPPAGALYQRAEIYRLRGEHAEAEEAYRASSQLGFDPQPGLALLRMAQGKADVACAAMRRTMGATSDRVQRARLLPSFIEIMLATGEIGEARNACLELRSLAESFAADVLRAAAAQATGAVTLAGQEANAALAPLRAAFDLWTQLGAPYEAARVRVLVALACRALGDEDTALLELAAARATFQELVARVDLARIDLLEVPVASDDDGRLTPREKEVLRMIAGGDTNKGIAGKLGLSGRTVDRHVSNILNKLDVPSRAAATAYAYQHELL